VAEREKGPPCAKIDFEIKALEVTCTLEMRSTNSSYIYIYILYIYRERERKSESLFFSLHSGIILISRLVINGVGELVKDS